MTEHQQVPGLRLGRRPASTKPTLKASAFLRAAAVPTVPNAVDHLGGFEYDLGRNDSFGTCGPTSLSNYVRLVTAKLTGATVAATWADIKRLYVRQNPQFNETTGADDNGVDMKQMLADAVKYGFTDGVKVLGFAEVDVHDPEQVQAAVAIFGGVLLGLDLQSAQQAQTSTGTWDYSHSAEWGGHAVCEGAYEANEDEDVITWAQRVKMTRAFVTRQRQEAYVVILDTHLGNAEFMAGWDLTQFSKAYTDITGRPFPAVVPPQPPTPPNPPEPPPHSDALVAAAKALAADRGTVEWLAARHSGVTKRVAKLVQAVVDAVQQS